MIQNLLTLVGVAVASLLLTGIIGLVRNKASYNCWDAEGFPIFILAFIAFTFIAAELGWLHDYGSY